MSLTFQPVRVNTGFEEEGVLVFDEHRRLSAVLVRLSDAARDCSRAMVSGGRLRTAGWR